MDTDSWKLVTTRNLAARYEMRPHDGSNRLMPADLVSLMLAILARDIRLEAIGYIDSIEKTYRWAATRERTTTRSRLSNFAYNPINSLEDMGSYVGKNVKACVAK